MISMLLVDDEYLVRRGLRETIDWSAMGVEVVGEAANGQEGLKQAEALQPDIIITDICMPVMDGLDFIAGIKEKSRHSVVIILSGYGEFDFAKEAMKNGAFAYILKPIDEVELSETVREAVAKVEKNTFHENLENALPLLRQHFLTDLLQNGTVIKQTFEEKCEFFGYDLYSDGYCVAYLIVHQVLSPGSDLLHLAGRVFDGVPNLKALPVSFGKGDAAVLISFAGDSAAAYDAVKAACRELVSAGRDAFVMTVGISSVTEDVEQISRLYREAVKAASFRSNPEMSGVVSIHEADWDNLRKEVREAIRYINENYQENITVKTIANKLFMSRSNLMHIFREETGLTFNEYLTKTRIDAAKELLRDVRYKVYEVGEMVGYTDVKYFSQIFKKMTGYTPSEYARLDEGL